jgi:nucleotide-binding universal stress UspA family protein
MQEVTMIALKRILVATDFSEPAKVAVAYGRDLARQYDAALHVVHVIENVLAYYGSEAGFALADVERNIAVSVQKDLDAAIAADGDGPLNAVAVVERASNVAQAITDYARNHAIDLIVVGTHGRGAVSRFLMGSVAERVVRSAPCPVLTVRADERDFVDVTGGEGSRHDDPGTTSTHHH